MTAAVKNLSRNRGAAGAWGNSSREELDAYNQAKADLTALAKERWDDPAFHREVAADI